MYRKAHSFTFGKLLGWPKSKALIRFAALATFASGAANLYFAANAPHRAHGALQAILPLEFFHYPRSFKLFLGFALIVSAVNIYKRKRRAFQIVLALSALSFG